MATQPPAPAAPFFSVMVDSSRSETTGQNKPLSLKLLQSAVLCQQRGVTKIHGMSTMALSSPETLVQGLCSHCKHLLGGPFAGEQCQRLLWMAGTSSGSGSKEEFSPTHLPPLIPVIKDKPVRAIQTGTLSCTLHTNGMTPRWTLHWTPRTGWPKQVTCLTIFSLLLCGETCKKKQSTVYIQLLWCMRGGSTRMGEWESSGSCWIEYGWGLRGDPAQQPMNKKQH